MLDKMRLLKTVLRSIYPDIHKNSCNFANSLYLETSSVMKHSSSQFHSSSSLDGQSSIKIGCASGFWGDTPTASSQLIKYGELDFIIYDYLSEITMSLLTAARAKRPELGYAPDFIQYAIGPYLKSIKDKGIKIISNAGGINPQSCASALREACKKAGVHLKIGVVSGDDILHMKDNFLGIKDMSEGTPLPNSIHSMNIYMGSGPIVKCLEMGADIVVTGRVADSALALAPLIYAFGWKENEYDLLASGSLAGHLIECGAQVTGGICSDWEAVSGWDQIGYPIAEVSSDGVIRICKPPNTGGLVSFGTVSEQLVYEIGDPRAYVLPDVVCDFSDVKINEIGCDVVEVKGAVGKPPTDSLKVCATYLDGFKATAVCCIGGAKSCLKGHRVAESIIQRCRSLFALKGIKDFSRTEVQMIGSDESYPFKHSDHEPREAVLWLSVHHASKEALQMFAMEVASAGTSMAPGLTGLVGGRPKPSLLLRLHSFLLKKENFSALVDVDGTQDSYSLIGSAHKLCEPAVYQYTDQPISDVSKSLFKGNKKYLLGELAYTRSGDKGNTCNIGVVSRNEKVWPYIKEALTTETVAQYFKHLYPEGVDPVRYVKRYELNGIRGLNFVLESSLGGGGIASLRWDPQGKALGQMLAEFELTQMPHFS